MKKPWHKSKAIWAGALLIVFGLWNAFTTAEISPDVVVNILTGFGIVGIRDALD